MPTVLPPAQMTAAERLDEVAEILAIGLARLQGIRDPAAGSASMAAETSARDTEASREAKAGRRAVLAGAAL